MHELMHVKEIGKPWIETRDGIIDQPVSDWPGREGEQAYGPTFTKWLAQDLWGIYDEVVENADNYACKLCLGLLCMMKVLTTAL